MDIARRGRRSRFAICAAAAAASLVVARPVRGDDTIKRPGDHPEYSAEIEPHGIVGWAAQWVGTGFGVGGRISISLTHNGFVRSINDSVALGVGVDWAHYSATGCVYDPHFPANCYGRGYYASADFLQFPVVMQWNFFVAQRWSVFGEPGLYVYHGIYSAPNYPCNGPGLPPCDYFRAFYGADTGIGPAFWVGARFHFSETAALTMRLGYPDLVTIGVSIMP